MKKIGYIGLLIVCSVGRTVGQNQDSTSSNWNFSTDATFYFIPDDFFVLPIFRADKNNLHLEARYNYEDRETFSGWVGYNFSGGDDEFSYTFTPMLGGVVGSTQGISPGLEFTVAYKRFELYSEMENLIDPKNSDNNYYYNWADFTYSPTDWLWVGISGQRTRLFQTDLEIQRGLMVGASLKNWELHTYLYNFGFDDPILIITLAVGF